DRRTARSQTRCRGARERPPRLGPAVWPPQAGRPAFHPPCVDRRANGRATSLGPSRRPSVPPGDKFGRRLRLGSRPGFGAPQGDRIGWGEGQGVREGLAGGGTASTDVAFTITCLPRG